MPQENRPPRVFATPIMSPISSLALGGCAYWLIPSTNPARSSILLASIAVGGIFSLQIFWNAIWLAASLYTREGLAQRDLESAYSKWHEWPHSQIGSAEELLRRAKAHTRSPKVAERIDEALSGLATSSEGCSERHASIAATLLSLLGLHSSLERRPRACLEAKYGPVVAVYLCQVAALTSGLTWLVDASGLFSAESVWLRAGIAALLAHTALRSVMSRRSVITHYRAQQGFRTVLWLTRAPSEQDAQTVLEALYELGELVVLVVDDVGSTTPPPFLSAFARQLPERCRLGSLEHCSRVLQGVIAHTDLLVVLGGDLLKLPKGLDATDATVPLDRRLFVVEDRAERAPKGYTGLFSSELNADALRGRFCAAAVADPGLSYGGTRYEYANDSFFYNLGFLVLYLGLALILREHWRWLGTFCVMTGCSVLFPKFLGSARRRSRSRSLRTPRAPALSAALLNLYNVTLYVAATAACLWSIAVSRTPWLQVDHLSLRTIPDFAISLLLGWLSWVMLAPGILRAIKWGIDWNFRILLLRRNLPELAHLHKAAFMPACGAYGQVICISDDNLSSDEFFSSSDFANRFSPFQRMANSLAGGPHEVLSESLYTMHVRETHEGWQRRIERELDSADFVVFDWTDHVSEDMRWELKEAIVRLPSARLLMFSGIENHAQIRQELNELGASICCIPLSRDVAQSRFHVAKWLRQLLPRLEHGPRILG